MSSSKVASVRSIRSRQRELVASLIYQGTLAPKIVRVIEAFSPSARDDNKQAALVLESVLNRLQGEKALRRTQFLITCGGFLQCNWPRDLKASNPSSPSVEDVKRLSLEAKRTCDEFLRPFLPRIRKVSRCITIGVDCNNGTDQAAELIYVRDLDTNSVTFTGKSYPTKEQERRLLRFPMRSHFLRVGQRVLVLGCHA